MLKSTKKRLNKKEHLNVGHNASQLFIQIRRLPMDRAQL